MKKLFICFTLWIGYQATYAAPDTVTCNRNQSTFNCMVCNCYHETRGEPMEGKIAVAKTVLSRKENDEFPDTVCGVVYQPAQFSWTADKYKNNISASKPEDKSALQACRAAVDLSINEGPNGLIYFYNPRKVTPGWARRVTSCGRAGEHVFLVPRGEKCPKYLGANRGGSQQKSNTSGGGAAR
ncbi:cell wall hydrolase [Pseudobdellovibrio sp. HCB154]|uniref:cell wall hydrolase n=1 Tax=Pseudobdellovibrio sp. HCB154 TaxID=3386277 RepID=UPI0039171E05